MTRRSRLAIAIVAAVVVLSAVVVFSLPTIVRRVRIWQIGAQTGRAVTIERVGVRLAPGRFTVRDLRVIDRDGSPLATIESVEVRFRARDLLRLHLRIVDGLVQAATLRVVRTGPRTFNISDLIKPGGGGGGRFAISVDRFAVRDGALTLEDRTVTPVRVVRVEALTVDARDASTIAGHAPGAVDVSAHVAGAPIAVAMKDVRLGPLHFQATATARGVDVGLAALAWPAGLPVDAPRGTLDASATIDHDGVAGSRVSLELGLGAIELRRPGHDRALVTAPAIKVTIDDLRARQGVLELKRLAVDRA